VTHLCCETAAVQPSPGFSVLSADGTAAQPHVHQASLVNLTHGFATIMRSAMSWLPWMRLAKVDAPRSPSSGWSARLFAALAGTLWSPPALRPAGPVYYGMPAWWGAIPGFLGHPGSRSGASLLTACRGDRCTGDPQAIRSLTYKIKFSACTTEVHTIVSR
jgi:hypothetical protein